MAAPFAAGDDEIGNERDAALYLRSALRLVLWRRALSVVRGESSRRRARAARRRAVAGADAAARGDAPVHPAGRSADRADERPALRARLSQRLAARPDDGARVAAA